MDDKKSSFVVYQSSRKIVEKLSAEQAGTVFKNLFRYTDKDELIEMDSASDIVFTCIQDYLDKDTEKYKAICERNRKNGKNGGRPNKNPKNPSGFSDNPKNLESESDSESESDIEYREREKHAHGEYQNVFLTDAELESLKKDYPDYQKKIDYLSSYMEEHGKTYINHFAVIVRWDREDKAKQSTANKGNKFSTSEASVTDYASIEELLVRN